MRSIQVFVVLASALILGCGSGLGRGSGDADSGRIMSEELTLQEVGSGDLRSSDLRTRELDQDGYIASDLDTNQDAAGDLVDPEARFEPLVQAVQLEMAALGVSGVSVAVIENGQVTFARGFGVKKPGGQEPVQADTLFRIGSTTKMLTAAALIRQVELGLVELDSPVVDILPGFQLTGDPELSQSLTVRQLLTHTSGIVDYGTDNAAPEYREEGSLKDYLLGPLGDICYFMVAPGTFYNYTNPGFMLAGLVAQEVSGSSYRQLMEEQLFAPLQMDRTFFLTQDVLDDGDFAWGQAPYPPYFGVVGPESYNNPWGWPAGVGTWSSALDLARFASFLLQGNPQVLSEEALAWMKAPQVSTREAMDHLGYGYGLMTLDGFFLAEADGSEGSSIQIWVPGSEIGFVKAQPNCLKTDYFDLPMLEHGGAISGYSADFKLVPSLGFGFITLANSDGARFSHSFAVALNTLTELPPPVPAPGDLELDASTLDGFTGTFLEPRLVGRIELSRQDEKLLMTMPDLDDAGVAYQPELIWVAPEVFVAVVDGEALAMKFVADESGTFVYLATRIAVGTRSLAKHRGASMKVDLQELRGLLHGPRAMDSLSNPVFRGRE